MMNEIRFPLDVAGGVAPVNGRSTRFLFKEGSLTISGLTMEDVILLFQRKALTGPFDVTLHGHSMQSAQLTLDRLAAPLSKPPTKTEELPADAQSAKVAPETAMQRYLRQLENEIAAEGPLPLDQWEQLANRLIESANHFTVERLKELQTKLNGRKPADPLAPPTQAASTADEKKPKREKTKVNKAPEQEPGVAIVSLPPEEKPTPAPEPVEAAPKPAPAPVLALTPPPPPLSEADQAIVAKLVALSGIGLDGAVRTCIQDGVEDTDRVLLLLRTAKPEFPAFKNPTIRDRISTMIANIKAQAQDELV